MPHKNHPSCKAPMNATGSYNGTWKGNAEDAEECELSMTLDQDITAEPLDNFKVAGTVLVPLASPF